MLRNLLKRRKTEAFAAQAQTAGSGSVTGAAGPRAAVSGRHRRTGGVDWWLFAIMCMLLSIGLVMVLSASGIVAESSYGDKYYFFKRQVVYALVGGVVLWVAAVLPRSFLYKMQYPFIFFCLLLLLVTLSPLSPSINGAHRWIKLGPINLQPMEFVKISAPTMEMTFSVNDSPFAGREGKFVTSRQIRDRLQKELLKDVALRVEDSATNDSFRVMGRGEMHLSILIETMRREGYELQVSPPKVLTHVENGKTMEPMERVVIDVPTQYQGAVMTALGARKGILQQMEPIGTRVRLEFRMPSRGLFGYRNQFLTDTHGEGILNTIFDGYEEWCGDITCRSTGSLVSYDTGDAVTYGLFNAQGRGTLIVTPGEKVYEGMVVGYTPTGEDITVNVCKTKHLTNTRASGSDDALRLVPVSKFSLEGCLEFLAPDELLEVTPENLRIRKRILSHDQRMKATHKKG